MGYPTQPGFPIHQNCANFRNGLCTLIGVAVDPNGPACPNFTPKSMTAKPQPARAYPEARQPYQPYPPQITQGYPPYMRPQPQIGYGFPPMPYHPPRYPYTPFPYPNPPQTGYGYTPPYPYPPRIGYGQGYGYPHMIDPWRPPQVGYGYPTPQYGYDYSHPPPYTPQTGYGYRPRYGLGRGPSALTAPRQGDAGYAAARPRGGGGGRMGGFGAGGGRGGGRGRGRMGGFAAGAGGSCVCPSCGYSTSHAVGTPCYQQVCPQCGSKMTRGR